MPDRQGGRLFGDQPRHGSQEFRMPVSSFATVRCRSYGWVSACPIPKIQGCALMCPPSRTGTLQRGGIQLVR